VVDIPIQSPRRNQTVRDDRPTTESATDETAFGGSVEWCSQTPAWKLPGPDVDSPIASSRRLIWIQFPSNPNGPAPMSPEKSFASMCRETSRGRMHTNTVHPLMAWASSNAAEAHVGNASALSTSLAQGPTDARFSGQAGLLPPPAEPM
jgi:hypothetical protein